MQSGLSSFRRLMAYPAAKELRFALTGAALAGLIFLPVIRGERTFFSHPDNSIQSFAWLTKVMHGWRQLDPPLWDFSIQGGTSFVGELQTGVFYPLTIALAWLISPPSLYALDLFVLLHFAMAFYFMVFFLRTEVRPEAAIVGGLVFAFVGTVARRANAQVNIFMGMVYLPLILGLFVRGLKSGRVPIDNPWLYASGAALACALLAGHLQPYIHAAAILALLTVFVTMGSQQHRWGFSLRALMFVGLVSICLTTIQWLPTIEYLERAYRWIGLDVPVPGLSPPPFEVYTQLEILHPTQLAGIFSPAVEIRDGPMLFVTLTGLGFAVLGCFDRSRLARLGLTIVIVSVLLALGQHTLVGRASWYVPVITYVREPVRALFLYQFGMAVLAALGVRFITERFGTRRFAAMALAGLISAGVIAEAVGARDWVILRTDSKLTPSRYYARDPLVQFLEQRLAGPSGLYRIDDQSRVLPPNVGNVYAIRSIGGHRATINAAYFDFMWNGSRPLSVRHRLASARYVVSPTRLADLSEVFRSDRGYVYERDQVLPLFQIVTSAGERRAAPISAVSWSSNGVSIALESPVAGELVFAQPAYPGWRVTLDGRAVTPRNHDLFMSVPLAGAERGVTWAYVPRFRWIGGLSAAFVAGIALWSVGRSRRARLTRVHTSSRDSHPREVRPA